MPGSTEKPRQPRRYCVKLPEQTPLLNEYLKVNQYKRPGLIKTWAWYLMIALTRDGWKQSDPVIEYCNIEILRCCERGNLDWDGLYGGVKPVLDALTRFHPKLNKHGLGVIYDDNVTRIKELSVKPLFEFSGKPFTQITITELLV